MHWKGWVLKILKIDYALLPFSFKYLPRTSTMTENEWGNFSVLLYSGVLRLYHIVMLVIIKLIITNSTV